MVARVLTVAPIGFEGTIIEVESDAKKGLPSVQIVGMGNKSIDEAKERVRSAISNSLLEFPAKKLVINLAPAELPKDGAHFDLPIAKTLINLLPPLTPDEQIATTKLHSIAGEIDGEILTTRPFRSPHHTASHIAITGGGNKPKPGEISLAYLGVIPR